MLVNICPLPKQQKVAFPISNTRTLEPFTIIHIDIWGPYKEQSYIGAHFVLTIVEDYINSPFGWGLWSPRYGKHYPHASKPMFG